MKKLKFTAWDITKFVGLLCGLAAGIIDIIAMRKDSADVEELVDKVLESREEEEDED